MSPVKSVIRTGDLAPGDILAKVHPERVHGKVTARYRTVRVTEVRRETVTRNGEPAEVVHITAVDVSSGHPVVWVASPSEPVTVTR